MVTVPCCWVKSSLTRICRDRRLLRPFDFDYQNLHTAPEGSKSQPIARPRSLITGERMAKIEKGRTGKMTGGEFDKLAKDKNFGQHPEGDV